MTTEGKGEHPSNLRTWEEYVHNLFHMPALRGLQLVTQYIFTDLLWKWQDPVSL